MKRRMRTLISGGLILLAAATAVGAEIPGQSAETDRFFKAKGLVFSGHWAGVRSGMEAYLKDFPAGKLRDEALFWLSQSLDRLARDAGDTASAVELKRKSFASLDLLIREFPDSRWRDDALERQIAVAGDLALLGSEEHRKFLEAAVAAGGKDGTKVKAAALNSILSLGEETALSALRGFFKTEADPGLRKKAVSVLGQAFPEDAAPLLEEMIKSDPDDGVREEAAIWLGKVRMRLIPLQVVYYCFDSRIHDPALLAKVPEGAVAQFKVPRGRPGSEARAKRAIEKAFGRGLEITGSRASMNSAVLEEMGFRSSVSHLIGGIRIRMEGSSIVKTENDVAGRILFDGVEAPFKVDETGDLILAARRGDRQAVMYLEMAPAPSFSNRVNAPRAGGEPVYASVTDLKGARIHSARRSWDSDAFRASLVDYGQAKAEITGTDGTWILIGDILYQKKDNVLIGRRARLIRPDGTTAAEAAEIQVPIADPGKFRKEPDKVNIAVERIT